MPGASGNTTNAGKVFTAMGCMRLSTDPRRDPERALATLHAALDAGVTLLDTADAYCLDDSEVGHNERLVRRALETWRGDLSTIRIATKGGLTRPAGAWVPDGRAKHLLAAAEASRRALGVDRIDLYQLHVPDPRVSLATSIRALATLQQQGTIQKIGLCNVTVRQIEEARKVADIAAVQVELGACHEASLRNGVAEYCTASGVLLLAYRPLGGAEGRARIQRDPVLGELAARHGATPEEIVLAWLGDLSPVIVPLPGPTRVETARSLARVRDIRVSDEDRAQLDRHFPAGRLLRTSREARRPPRDAPGDVVLVMGLPAAGKSTLAADLAARGYLRLNRDETGGRLRDLLPLLERALLSGRREVVLDNTYGSRAARNEVIEKAWEHGVPVRCRWLKTSLEDAQVNAVERMVSRYGRLLEPEEIAPASAQDPGVFGPGALFRHVRELEPPTPEEGFTVVEEVEFDRRGEPSGTARALLLWYDGVLRASRSGRRTPISPEDVALLPGRREAVRRHLDLGWLVLGLSWHPEIAAGTTTRQEVEASFDRTHELLGQGLDVLYCPHADGPPVCWCRKPMPGLGVLFIRRYGLDPTQCVYVGHHATDRAFAQRLGFAYRDSSEFFEETVPG